jgi:hypothetical protein
MSHRRSVGFIGRPARSIHTTRWLAPRGQHTSAHTERRMPLSSLYGARRRTRRLRGAHDRVRTGVVDEFPAAPHRVLERFPDVAPPAQQGIRALRPAPPEESTGGSRMNQQRVGSTARNACGAALPQIHVLPSAPMSHREQSVTAFGTKRPATQGSRATQPLLRIRLDRG